jgi:hypothetical protein
MPIAGGRRATGKLATLCNPPYSLTNEIAESVSDEGSADRSRCDAYGGVLLACRGKFPIHQLQKTTQFAVLLLKSLNAEPQRRYDVLFGKTLAVWWGIDSGDRSARSRAGTHDTHTQFFLAIQPCRRYPRFGCNGSEVDFPGDQLLRVGPGSALAAHPQEGRSDREARPLTCAEYRMNTDDFTFSAQKKLCKRISQVTPTTAAPRCARYPPAASITALASEIPCRSWPVATRSVRAPVASRTDTTRHRHTREP